MSIERLSIELTNRCSKQCHFCYNNSHAAGKTTWSSDEVVSFVLDCAKSGTKAVSFGGGEPLEYPGLFEVLQQLQGFLFRSVTSNGLQLRGETLEQLVAARPDKVHISIHFPERSPEVMRAIAQVQQLESRGIRSGINLLVSASNVTAAERAAQTLRESIGSDRIVYLPMRGTNLEANGRKPSGHAAHSCRDSETPLPKQVANVAGRQPFQSMSCLTTCKNSPRFCAISWDKQVAWCSYTTARRPLQALTASALELAIEDLPLIFCGHNNQKT